MYGIRLLWESNSIHSGSILLNPIIEIPSSTKPDNRIHPCTMIEDDIYRTSSQFRIWSFTEESLGSLRATTNTLASERVRAALRRAREARQSAAGTPNQSGGEADQNGASKGAGEEKDIECLTPEEEQELVRYYCEKTVELGDTYKPPVPTIVRVSACLWEAARRKDTIADFVYAKGHGNPISSSLLPHQFPHDLPPEKHHGLRALPRHKNRQLLHVPTAIRSRDPRRHDG